MSGRFERARNIGCRTDRPWNRGWWSDREPRRSDRPSYGGWWSDREPRWFDRQALRSSFVACFGRPLCGAHDFGSASRGALVSSRATRGPDVHDSDSAIHGSGVLALPVALLTSPSGCTGATITTSTSVVAAGEGRAGGTFGQLSSDDHPGEAGLPASGR
jgi:hypothetical protein